jgi:hypothetical protein
MPQNAKCTLKISTPGLTVKTKVTTLGRSVSTRAGYCIAPSKRSLNNPSECALLQTVYKML